MEFSINPLSYCEVIKINGRIDSYSAPIIQHELESLMLSGQHNIVVDMSDVSYLSSSGILVFLETHRKLMQQGEGALVFSNLPATILSVLQVTGLENVFNYCPDVQSAERRFQK